MWKTIIARKDPLCHQLLTLIMVMVIGISRVVIWLDLLSKTINDTYGSPHPADYRVETFKRYTNYLMCDFNGDGVCDAEDNLLFQDILGSCH